MDLLLSTITLKLGTVISYLPYFVCVSLYLIRCGSHSVLKKNPLLYFEFYICLSVVGTSFLSSVCVCVYLWDESCFFLGFFS